MSEHNPDNLKPEQVETNKGYRLLSKEEFYSIKKGQAGLAVQFWRGGGWHYFGVFNFLPEPLTIRTRKPEGYFLPQSEESNEKEVTAEEGTSDTPPCKFCILDAGLWKCNCRCEDGGEMADAMTWCTKENTSNRYEGRITQLERELSEAKADAQRARKAYFRVEQEVQQRLAIGLGGFPWYKDDQKNFPGTDEASGVCVGELLAEDLAVLVGKEIQTLREQLAEAQEDSERLDWLDKNQPEMYLCHGNGNAVRGIAAKFSRTAIQLAIEIKEARDAARAEEGVE